MAVIAGAVGLAAGTLGAAAVSTAVIGGVASVASAGIGAAQANKQRKSAERDKGIAGREIASLKASRQTIINPYEGSRDLSGLASNMSGLASDTTRGLGNPFASLGVATGAAEIQIEQADIALANTLDTLRATGASAGGATALAQAALQSKKGVAASIESQEASNAKARAQGEQNLNQAKMSEQQRLQSISISEGQRMQGLAMSEGQRLQSDEAAGKMFMFDEQEERTNADLDRASGKESQARQGIADANRAKAAAISGGISAIGDVAGAYIGAPKT